MRASIQPGCASLRPGGQVRGVFLRFNPLTADRALEEFRKRENRDGLALLSYDEAPSAKKIRRWLQLVAVLLQSNAHQLTSRPHTGLGEELLQASFYCGLRNLQPIRDLLVCQAFKNERKYMPLPFV